MISPTSMGSRGIAAVQLSQVVRRDASWTKCLQCCLASRLYKGMYYSKGNLCRILPRSLDIQAEVIKALGKGRIYTCDLFLKKKTFEKKAEAK